LALRITQAERLCAELLILEGFESVDPQCPLGGPDGLKDVLCEKNRVRCVAAAFFPQTYSQTEAKFCHDLEGVSVNRAAGLVFFTNQRLSPSERQTLQKLAQEANAECTIYHLERIRAVLDAPRGDGVRLEFLRIERPHRLQWCVNDDCLRGAKWWSHPNCKLFLSCS
jgi:hypothetical protein